jgi:DNA-binding NarL/FixJ family response regulator
MSTTVPSKFALGTGARSTNVRELLPSLTEQFSQIQGIDHSPRSGPSAGADLQWVAAEARAAVGEAAYAAAVAAARALAVAEALDEALAALEHTLPAPAVAPTSRKPTIDQAFDLSKREREVLALVAEGRSNKAIADELFVSPNTVKTHVASLLHKLHADTRVQLATLAARQGQS